MQKPMSQGSTKWIGDGVKISGHQMDENFYKVFAKIADLIQSIARNAISIPRINKYPLKRADLSIPGGKIRKKKAFLFDLVNNEIEEAFDWYCVA